MSRIMIIAGGEWQCPIAKTAKEMGHYIICSNLYENSPAFKYADVSRIADVRDKEKNLSFANELHPDAVITDQSDIAVQTVAYISEKLNLNGIGLETAKLFTNKYKMRDFCSHHGYPSPKYKLCESKEDAIHFFKNSIKEKAIIKPIDNQASRGIHVINSEDDLHFYFDDALSYSNESNKVLLEEYIDGTEFTVDGIKTKNNYIVTAISKKEHYDYNSSIAKKLVFSYDDDDYDYDALRELNTNMVFDMGLPFGLTHAEYKYFNGNFYLIEIAARGGGTRISSDIVPFMSGINSNEILIKEALKQKLSLNPSFDKDKAAMLGFFDFPCGKVKEITGIDEAKNMPGVMAMSLSIDKNSVISNAANDSSRIGYYILISDTKKALFDLEANFLNTIKIKY